MSQRDIQFLCSRASELNAEQVAQWRDLYLKSITPNVYMSPDFILTALETICTEDPLVVGVKLNGLLYGLGVLQQNRRSLQFPFRSRKLFKTIHSFQSGILLRNGITDEAIDALLSELVARGNTNLSFSDHAMTSESANRLFASAKRQNFHLYESRRYSRPILHLNGALHEWKTPRPKILKEADRQWRRLSELGALDWRFIPPDMVTKDTAEIFLTLEHNSWKGDGGTSLLSRTHDAAFFRSLVSKLICSREVFFTELRLNNDAIASTVNFMTRDVAFAYKIAWNKDFARFSPGILNEVSFIEYATTNEMPFAYIESGTNSQSFIARIWPGRISMSTGYVIDGHVAKVAASALAAVRQIVRPLPKVHSQRSTQVTKGST